MLKHCLAILLLCTSPVWVSAQSVMFPGPGIGIKPIIGTPVSIATGSNGSAASSIAVTTTTAVLSNDLLVCQVIAFGNPITSVSDGTNNYTQAVTQNEVSEYDDIWYKSGASPVAAGATITASFSGSTNIQIIACIRVAGIISSGALDKVNNAAAVNTGSASIATGTLSQANEIIIGTYDLGNNTSITINAPIIQIGASQVVQSTILQAYGYNIVSSTASVNVAGSWSPVSRNILELATFKGY
jgi:hypothetical protein